MQAYCLIRVRSFDNYHSFADKVSKIKGVLRADRVFGPWSIIAKIEGKTNKDISRIRDEILRCCDMRQIVTMISISQKKRNKKCEHTSS